MSAGFLGLAVAAAALALDQGSKALALSSPSLPVGVEVLPVMNLVLVRNDGVSFGMLGGLLPWWALVLLAFAIVAWLSVWLWRSQGQVVSVALGLVIGGALGNVVDRVRLQAVTDFLDFHVGAYHWPAFNLADVAVFSGAALLVWDSFRPAKARDRAEA
ncbi:signal peptidase II [Roseitranquillus sediminis]|uniref:signal peptidase II n=1 Tax=Roseitranquillus sediminis TaxID=2809051 RepID=UPI001D0C57EF|nr:signal peptidase II [Roseitranquillus sediminis]MBM9595137.1 signal peptidase II [Roseitranquillus sediminis]